MSNYTSVVECLNQLDTGSKVRLAKYRKNLITDKNPAYFDDRLKEFILPYLTPHGAKVLSDVNRLNDSVEYSASGYEFAQIQQQLQHFATPDCRSKHWLESVVRAKDFMLNEVCRYQLAMVDPASETELDQLIPKKTTHAGWIFIEDGRKTKGDYQGEYLRLRDEGIRRGLALGNFGYPILIGTRSQASVPWDDDHHFTGEWKAKTRLVSMIDLRVILAELPYARPVQDKLSGLNWYAGGKDDSTIRGILADMGRTRRYMTTLDYSKFDMHQSSWLIRMAFDIVKAMFANLSDHQSKVFDVIVNSYLDKTFVSDGIVHSFNGTPSGDMFTQIIDSIINRLMVLSYLFHKNVDPRDFEMMIMGDDNIIFTKRPLDFEEMSAYITHNFGIEVNPSKVWTGEAPEAPEFLSRRWTADGCDRADEVVVTKLLYPERFANYSQQEGNHPKFKIVSMIWSYPVAARRLINVREFLEEWFQSKTISKVYLRLNLSGYLRYALNYWSDRDSFRL